MIQSFLLAKKSNVCCCFCSVPTNRYDNKSLHPLAKDDTGAEYKKQHWRLGKSSRVVTKLGEGRNRIGRREEWSKKSWEEGEIGGKVGRREKKKRNCLGRREKLAQKSREEGEIGSESRERGDLPPGCLPFVRINRLGRVLNNAKSFSKISKPTERNGAYSLIFSLALHLFAPNYREPGTGYYHLHFDFS